MKMSPYIILKVPIFRWDLCLSHNTDSNVRFLSVCFNKEIHQASESSSNTKLSDLKRGFLGGRRFWSHPVVNLEESSQKLCGGGPTEDISEPVEPCQESMGEGIQEGSCSLVFLTSVSLLTHLGSLCSLLVLLMLLSFKDQL